MSSKVQGLIVTLDTDVSEELAEHIINAIRMMKCVLNVSPLPTNQIDDYIVKDRLRREIIDKLIAIVREETI